MININNRKRFLDIDVKYDICEGKPSRNKIIYNNESDILNSTLKNKISYLKSLRNNCNDFEIQITNLGFYSICTKKDLDKQSIEKLLADQYLSYLSINQKIYINKPLTEIINGYIIQRNTLSFHQNDDFIRKNVIDLIERKLVNIESILFIGGEMYMFGKIFKNFYKYAHFISDYSSIINDTKLNGINQNNIEHVIYDNYVVNNTYDIAICNTGKSGLGKLSKQLKSIKKLIIISCNLRSLKKDLFELNYNIVNFNILRTNYDIFFVYLEFKSN